VLLTIVSDGVPLYEYTVSLKKEVPEDTFKVSPVVAAAVGQYPGDTPFTYLALVAKIGCVGGISLVCTCWAAAGIHRDTNTAIVDRNFLNMSLLNC
jgi:hypothetical protein